MHKPYLSDLDWEQLETMMAEWGQPSFRTKQIFQWVHQKGILTWEEMTNIPHDLRDRLAAHYQLGGLKVIRRQMAADQGTVKFLLGLPDGATIEMVIMAYEHGDNRKRRTLCLSSQVGCRLRCTFCATGKSGFQRNLAVHEIVGQVLVANQALQAMNQGPITNLVFMGMGEPLDNYEAVVKAIGILHHPAGLNISLRRIAISTSGVVPGIYRLAEAGMPIVLAISLHAPNNELRSRLMPINRRYPMEELLDACRYWVKKLHRRITFEYVLLGGVNDGLEQAGELARLLAGLSANVNLIPFNAVDDTDFQKPARGRVEAFRRLLERQGVAAVIREEKGGEIAAACGQLRRQEMRDGIDNQV